ncbi:MAG: 50S ribosomal protein L4 [Candidatus Doudnabacteria bacterium]|nr:50S ribosomal protein L4 [bacterium]MDZ4244146.1 50S ribosomal protein L4 [Candidatus Doudnabacteria bacterium]
MLKVSVYSQSGEDTGSKIELNPKIFEIKELKPGVLHQVVTARLSNLRRATARTKTKGEVRGGGKKPWKQKGTGRARAGSIRSPLWRGGGIIFGPVAGRNFYKKVNKKTNRLALFAALTDRIKSNQLLVVDNIELQEAKTRELLQKIDIFAKKMKPTGKNVLIITPAKAEKLARASANLPDVKVITAANLNILDLLQANSIIVLKDALPEIEKTYL